MPGPSPPSLTFQDARWSQRIALAKRWREAMHALAEMQQVLQPDIVLFNMVLSSAARAAWPQGLRELQRQGLSPDEVTCGAAVKSAGEKGWQAAQAALWSAPHRSVVAFGAAMSAAERASGRGVWAQVACLHTGLRSLGLQPSTVTYNTWITSSRSNWRTAVLLLEELQEERLEPTVVTYAALISCMETAKRWEVALHLFKSISRLQLQTNIIACNSVVSACEKASQWTWALQMQQHAADCALQPSVVTFAAASSACEKAAQWQAAMSVLRSAGRTLLNVVAWNAFLGACQNDWQWERSLATLDALEMADVVSFTATITSSGDCFRWQVASGLLSCLSRKLQPDFSCLAASAAAFSQSAWPQALEVYELLQAQKHTGLGLYNSMLQGCQKGAAWRASSQLLFQQRLARVLADELSLQAALKTCAAQGAWQPVRR
ncbi:unnamed protein product, partial [Effrenium voratum]